MSLYFFFCVLVGGFRDCRLLRVVILSHDLKRFRKDNADCVID